MNNMELKILDYVSSHPGSKASEIALAVEVDRKEVNVALYGSLKQKVQQDSNYSWYLKNYIGNKPNTDKVSDFSDSPIARLSRYYLDCLSNEDLGGVSEFAQSKYGDTKYVELQSLPMFDEYSDSFNTNEVREFLNRIRRDRNRQTLLLGYPVRLNHIRSNKGWEGFLLEPILLFSFLEQQSKYDQPLLSDELPHVNIKALHSLGFSGDSSVLEEAILLANDLGLDHTPENLPNLDEVLSRLYDIRQDWDWREEINPYKLSSGIQISEIKQAGIYNRSVLCATERSPYTKGLETELNSLQSVKKEKYENTCLGVWLNGQIFDKLPANENQLIEVVPLNTEQRQAVKQALVNPLTVITGPPGTGKSQVVTSILINAAWQKQTVLFASKNNKAVDVVEIRVNSLGARPLLMRLGSNEYQNKLPEYLVTLLASTATADDIERYQELLNNHTQLSKQYHALNNEALFLIHIRNEVDCLEQQIEQIRVGIGQAGFSELRLVDMTSTIQSVEDIKSYIESADIGKQKLIDKLLWQFTSKKRFQSLAKIAESFTDTANKISLPLPTQFPNSHSIHKWIEYRNTLTSRVLEIESAQTYFTKLEGLTNSRTLEDINRQSWDIIQKLNENSEELWRMWLVIQPSQLTPEQRRLLGELNVILQMLIADREQSQKTGTEVKKRYYQLLPLIKTIISCWAVTSLSARGRIPLEPSFFDLLIIDEASQCDIASALPLLYRAKRAVIIGDPKQLRHISALSKHQDRQLLEKNSLINHFAAWAYSCNSLFDLASSLCNNEDIVALRDHHRSHSNIIEFSNKYFYEGRLRVATNYDNLRFIKKGEPVVRWLDVKGKTVRPPTGGAVNEIEAKAVVAEIERIVKQGYRGNLGVVSPFRAQANLIRDLINKHCELGNKIADMEFLVDTVHKFQGDERDVMIFSPVISSGVGDRALGFLRNNPNLFNVAVTRARAALIVIGDKATALKCNVDYLARFAAYSNQVNEYQEKKRINLIHDLGPEYPVVSNPEKVSEWEYILYKAMYKSGIRLIPQYCVEKYILDFALLGEARRLNIEVDGERYHRNWDGELCRRDQIRNHRLIELGWDVIRFWVYQVRDDMEKCIEQVQKWINKYKD